MSELLTYLRLGFAHILDLRGYDHILFVIALVAADVRQVKRLVWLVTAFTVGHSITLALSTFDRVRMDPLWIEALIPLTIVITSGITIAEVASGLSKRRGTVEANRSRAGFAGVGDASVADGFVAGGALVPRPEAAKYGLALLFGLIHGMGFSNFLRATLGAEDSIAMPLLGFNVGVEVGQLLIVLAAVLLTHVVVRFTALVERDWLLVLSGATGGVALIMLLQRLP